MSEATAGRCMACGGNGEHALSGLTVRTLHVRGIGGEKRVQALGGVQTGCVCRACAEKQLAKERDLFRATAPRLEIFAGIALLAVLALILRPQLPDGKGRLWLIISAVMLGGALLAAFGT